MIRFLANSYGFRFEIPYTTRSPRSAEEIDRDYHFLTKEVFQDGIRNGIFSDWDFALSNYYGHVEGLLANAGEAVVNHSLARMAVRLRAKALNTVLVFLQPAQQDTILYRLNQRENVNIESRLLQSQEELTHAALFDHILTVEGGEDGGRQLANLLGW